MRNLESRFFCGRKVKLVNVVSKAIFVCFIISINLQINASYGDRLVENGGKCPESSLSFYLMSVWYNFKREFVV